MAMLIDQCDVLVKQSYGTAADDAYGQPPQQFITKISAMACRVSTMKGGSEYKTGKEYAKNSFRVFMLPPSQDDSGLPFSMDTHAWLKIVSANGRTLATPIYLNIISVNDPSFLGHHLECVGDVVQP